jgi:rhodanese-related sulfurtransferase
LAVSHITSAELRFRLEATTEHAIIDIRREGDYAAGHLFFATNIPRSLLELKIERLVPRLDTPVTLCGANEADAAEATRLLQDFGYRNVSVLSGGVSGWSRDGGQLFSGMNVPSKAFGEFVEHAAETPHILPSELSNILAKSDDVVILDARPFSEYRMMSIPGAINCPGGELVYRFAANVPSSATLVVVNCAGRTRSIMGAQSLIDARVPNKVVALRDGTMGWHLAGLILKHEQTRRAAEPSKSACEPARAAAMEFARDAGVRFLTADEFDTLAVSSTPRTTYFFDVRDTLEFLAGHRSNAVSAPGGQLIQTLDSFVAVRGARIVVIDSDGVRAPMAAAWLKQMGHHDVFAAVETRFDETQPHPTPRLRELLASAPTMAAPDAAKYIDAGAAVILDLANSKDFRKSHIPDALFCERHQIEDFTPDHRDKKFVILTSPDGLLAAVAARSLTSSDGRIIALEGGTSAWVQAGYILVGGTGNLPNQPTDVYYRPYDLSETIEKAMQAYLDWEKDLIGRLADEPGVSFSYVRGGNLPQRAVRLVN